MLELGGYEFQGVYTDPRETQVRRGVYAVVCVVDERPHCVLDIGTSGKVQERLLDHDRKSCWREHTHEEIGYYVKYTGHDSDVEPRDHAPPIVRKSDDSTMKERLIIEDELQWKYDVPCGTNHWKQKEKAIARYNSYEQTFGPRGHHELD